MFGALVAIESLGWSWFKAFLIIEDDVLFIYGHVPVINNSMWTYSSGLMFASMQYFNLPLSHAYTHQWLVLALLRTQPLADTLSIGPMIYIWSSLGCQWINSNDQPIVTNASAPTIIIGNNSAIFQYQIIKGLFCQCGYIWIPARISDHILSKVYEEITYPFCSCNLWIAN